MIDWKTKATVTAQKLAKVDADLDCLLKMFPSVGGKPEVIQKMIELIRKMRVEINGEDEL